MDKLKGFWVTFGSWSFFATSASKSRCALEICPTWAKRRRATLPSCQLSIVSPFVSPVVYVFVFVYIFVFLYVFLYIYLCFYIYLYFYMYLYLVVVRHVMLSNYAARLGWVKFVFVFVYVFVYAFVFVYVFVFGGRAPCYAF